MLKKLFNRMVLSSMFCILVYPVSITGYERCVKSRDVCTSYKRMARIFSGTLIKAEEKDKYFQYIFSVDIVYKGTAVARIVCNSFKEVTCFQGPILKQGEKYLVFSHGSDNDLYYDAYFNTKTLAESALELKILRENERSHYLNSKKCESRK